VYEWLPAYNNNRTKDSGEKVQQFGLFYKTKLRNNTKIYDNEVGYYEARAARSHRIMRYGLRVTRMEDVSSSIVQSKQIYVEIMSLS
jgi:hypothetical protein